MRRVSGAQETGLRECRRRSGMLRARCCLYLGAWISQNRASHFSCDEPGIFEPIREMLLTKGDFYLHLADLPSYCQAQQKVGEVYASTEEWARKAILNVACSGKFSSDRTIAEYARDIWHADPCPVE